MSHALTLLAVNGRPDSIAGSSAVVWDALSQTIVLTAAGGPAGPDPVAALGPDRIPLDIAMLEALMSERRQAEEALEQRHDELTRFNWAAGSRERCMIGLKRKVNELCRRPGEPPSCGLAFRPQGGVEDPAITTDRAQASQRQENKA